MLLLKLAVRNVFRNVRRTLISAITVIVGTMALVAAYGLILGTEETINSVDIKTNTGHLRVFRKGYQKEEESFPLNIVADQPEKVMASIKKKWPTSLVFKRIVFSAKVIDGPFSLPARGNVIPQKASKRFTFLQSNGKLMPDDGNVIFVGYSLAKVFKKKVGDTITLQARTRTGSYNANDFRIAGIFNAGNPLIDGATIFLPEKSGRRFLEMPKAATEVIAFLPHRDDSLAAASLISSVTAKNHPFTWQDRAKDLEQTNNIRKKMFNFLILILMLVAAAGLANTILIAGYERKGEVGMMLAMGYQRSRIIALFALEASFIGLLGGVIGTFLGSGITLYYQYNGLDISAKMEAIASSPTAMSSANILYFQLSPTIVIVGVLLGVFTAVLAALWPASRITRLEPREILAGG